MYIKIPETIYKNENLTHAEIVVYSFIEAVAITMVWSNTVYINSDMISYYMYGEYTARNSKLVKGAIKSLVEKNIIKLNGDIIKKEDVILQWPNLYASVPVESLQKILGNKYPLDVVYYFIRLVATCNVVTKVGNQTIDYLSEITGLSKSTIIRYNKILEDLGIMIFSRTDSASKVDGEFKHTKNKYALVGNLIPANNESSNNKRSMAAKYNYIINNPDRVSDDEIMKVRDYYSSTEKAEKLDDIMLFT